MSFFGVSRKTWRKKAETDAAIGEPDHCCHPRRTFPHDGDSFCHEIRVRTVCVDVFDQGDDHRFDSCSAGSETEDFHKCQARKHSAECERCQAQFASC